MEAEHKQQNILEYKCSHCRKAQNKMIVAKISVQCKYIFITTLLCSLEIKLREKQTPNIQDDVRPSINVIVMTTDVDTYTGKPLFYAIYI